MGVPLVAAFCLAVQLISATFLVRDFHSPNAATMIATSIAERGAFAVHAWPRTARTPAGDEEPLRAYHLPAEPLFLAVGFRLLPAALRPYLHVPVTILFVAAVAAVGVWAGGRTLGVVAGTIASLDPFVVLHGPVWDDVFLAAALEWTVFSALIAAVTSAGTSQAGGQRPLPLVVVTACTALAVLTRGSSHVVLGIVALGLIARPRFRAVRAHGWAMLLAIALALGIWGTRNYSVLGEFFVGSSHDGITLFESNYATARPSLFRTGIAESYVIEDFGPHFGAVASMSELDANRYFTRQAVEYVADHPLDAAVTGGLKFFLSLTGINLGQPLTTARNRGALVTSGALLIFGIVGWRWWPGARARPEVQLLVFLSLVVTTVTLVGLAAGPVGLRYRLGATPFLYLGAAALTVGARRHTASHPRV